MVDQNHIDAQSVNAQPELERPASVPAKKRGLASMDPEKRREIARKGGQAVSGDRQHMSRIGRKGSEARWKVKFQDVFAQ